MTFDTGNSIFLKPYFFDSMEFAEPVLGDLFSMNDLA